MQSWNRWEEGEGVNKGQVVVPSLLFVLCKLLLSIN